MHWFDLMVGEPTVAPAAVVDLCRKNIKKNQKNNFNQIS